MESITLQTSDSSVVVNDILGRLGFAASSESDGGDSVLVAAMIKAVAEETFGANANRTSIVFSTANSATANDRLKITSDGHFVPVSGQSCNVGSSTYPFTNVYSDAFIKSGGTSSQFLKADGSVDGSTYTKSNTNGSAAYAAWFSSTYDIRYYGSDTKDNIYVSTDMYFQSKYGMRFLTDTSFISGTERLHLDTSEAVFNDGGNNYRFRIEGVSDTHLLFTDALYNRVGIGTASPVEKLYVDGSIGNLGWRINEGAITTTGSGAGNGVAITLNAQFGTTLTTTFQYKVRLTTYGTGTNTGATYIVWYNTATSAWVIRAVGLESNTSNHPLLEESGGELIAYTNHASAYSIRYLVESYNTGDSDSKPNSMGADYHWQRLGSLLSYMDGDVGIGTASPSVKLDVAGAINSTLASNNKFVVQTSSVVGKLQAYDATNSVYAGAESNSHFVLRSYNTDRLTLYNTNEGVWNENANNYDFRVEGTLDEYLLITNANTNKVGIGVELPTAKLEIADEIIGSGTLLSLNGTSWGDGEKAYLSWNRGGNYVANIGAELTGGATNAHIVFETAANTERMRITSDGKVGIGTASPSSKLELVGAGSTSDSGILRISDPSSGGTTSWIKLYAEDSSGFDPPLTWHIAYSDLTFFRDLEFRTSFSSVPEVTISQSGTLNVEANGTSTKRFKAYDFYGTTYNTASLPAYTFANDLDTGMWLASANNLCFSTAGLERLRIDSDGKVGIGTASPQAKLDVNGTVQFDDLVRWEHPDKALDASTSTLGYIRLYDESAGYCGFGVSTSNFNIGSSGLINVRAVVNAQDRLILRTDGSNTLYYGAGKRLDITKYTDAADGLRLGDIYGNAFSYQGLSHASFTSNASYMIMSEGTNTLISADTGGSVFIRGGPNYSYNEVKVYPDSNGVVVNEQGYTSDFRVEGDADTHLLYVKGSAGTDRVGIGTASPSEKLDVNGKIKSTLSYTAMHSATNIAVGWYTVAVNYGNRAIGRFGLTCSSGGRHQGIIFYASHFYGLGNQISVLHNNRYSLSNPVAKLRIKEGGTYDGCLLQVYIDDATNTPEVYLLNDNINTAGWVVVDWVPDGTNPGGVSNFAALTNVAAEVDLDTMDFGTTGQTSLDGPVVINEGGSNNDFRVEGDADQNLLFTDASADRVGIKTSSPDRDFHVNGETHLDGTTIIGTGLPSLGYRLTVDGNAKIDQLNINGNFTFPTTDGSADQVLVTNGSGSVSWQDQNSSNSSPVGTVIWYAANSAPTGYLKANGAAISRTAYATLFSVIGTTYGAGDGSTTFNLPDLRGEFVRGWDDSRGVDSGRSFGSAQSDQLQSHQHTMPYFWNNSNNGDIFRPQSPPYGSGRSVTSARGNGSTFAFSATTNGVSVSEPDSVGSSSGTGYGTENRPRNVALLPCIKY